MSPSGGTGGESETRARARAKETGGGGRDDRNVTTALSRLSRRRRRCQARREDRARHG